MATQMDLINVQIKFQDDVKWQSGTDCDYKLNDDQVDVWRIKISSNLTFIDDFFKVLLPDEIMRANRYVHVYLASILIGQLRLLNLL
jgi:4'-phosphopantetheinyl transferase